MPGCTKALPDDLASDLVRCELTSNRIMAALIGGRITSARSRPSSSSAIGLDACSVPACAASSIKTEPQQRKPCSAQARCRDGGQVCSSSLFCLSLPPARHPECGVR
jgi:hypothetical protein